MNRMKRFFIVAAFAIAVTLLVETRTEAATAHSRVESHLKALHSWLETSRFGLAWRTFLKSDALTEQLEQGAAADPRVVAEVLDQYNSAAAGLDRRRFAAVRQALEVWLAELTQTDLADLPTLARDAKSTFRPSDEKELARKKAALEDSAAQFDKFLSGGSRSRRVGWKKYLQWETLLAALHTDESPDLRALRRIEGKFFALYRGLELGPFDAVRQRLRNYTNALIVADPRTAQYYTAQLDKLATHLEAYIDQPSGESALAIGRILGWLESAGQARWLVAGVRGQFWRPNLRAHVSQRLIAAGFQDKVSDTRPINEFIMGTSIRGTAHTIATISLDFVPNDRRAAFDFRLSGLARSRNSGTRGPVTVYSHGTTTIDGRTRIFIDETGFSARPAVAHCSTASVIDDVAARFRIIENIGWRAALKNQGKAEAMGSRRTESRLRQQIDAQVKDIVANLNDYFVERFRNPLLRKDHFPNKLRFRTSNERLDVLALQAGTFQVGAASEAPELIDDLDVAVRVHESLVGNFSEGLLGGETLDNAKLAELIENVTGERPEDSSEDDVDDEPWSITFSQSQPIAVSFDDNQITLSIRGRKFTRGEQAINDTIAVTVVYSIEKTAGGSVMKRQGDVEVEYVNRTSLGTGQITFKRFMSRKLTSLFKEEIVGKGIELEGRWAKVSPLRLEQLHCDDGWAALGWRAPPADVLTAKAKSGKTK